LSDSHGNNALHHAAAEKMMTTDIIASLAAAGVGVNAMTTKGGIMGEAGISDGCTPLHIAAANGLASNAAALVASGADVRLQSTTADQERNGATPLHAMLCRADACRGFESPGGASKDAETLITTLLGNGDVAHIRDAKGRTPLELAIESREYLITMFDGRNNDRKFGGASGRETEYKRLEGAIRFLGGSPNLPG
jgi:ankyrin repeat protein